ncbi:uncharacterized protein M421DRAFT_59500, partial [Didymella exigua CBS 183.55]
MTLEDALKDTRAANARGELCYQKIADTHGVDRSTLSRYHQGVRSTMQQKIKQQQNLTPYKELELVDYIDQLCREHLPPTRDMVQHFASIICGFEVGKTWVTRFVQRHHEALTPQWTSAMASERHAADSYSKYSLYFDMLELKISEKGIEPEHTYNMDEKGFMIGKIGKQKRVFSRTSY